MDGVITVVRSGGYNNNAETKADIGQTGRKKERREIAGNPESDDIRTQKTTDVVKPGTPTVVRTGKSRAVRSTNDASIGKPPERHPLRSEHEYQPSRS